MPKLIDGPYTTGQVVTMPLSGEEYVYANSWGTLRRRFVKVNGRLAKRARVKARKAG